MVRGLWFGDAFIIEHASHERTYLAAIAELLGRPKPPPERRMKFMVHGG